MTPPFSRPNSKYTNCWVRRRTIARLFWFIVSTFTSASATSVAAPSMERKPGRLEAQPAVPFILSETNASDIVNIFSPGAKGAFSSRLWKSRAPDVWLRHAGGQEPQPRGEIRGGEFEESLSLPSLIRRMIETFGFVAGNKGIKGGQWVLEPVFLRYSCHL